MSDATDFAIALTERGMVPTPVIRAGIRKLVRERLAEINASDCEAMSAEQSRFVAAMDAAEIAPVPHLANEQHYEVPAAFFGEVLGKHRKYSSCWWPEGVTTLDEAEARSLAATCEHAEASKMA